METYKEPNIWYTFRNLRFNLSAMTDPELEQLAQSLDEGIALVEQAIQARERTNQEVLQFYEEAGV